MTAERRPRDRPSTAAAGSARSTMVRVVVAMVITLVAALVIAASGLIMVRQQVQILITTVTPATTANRAVRQAMADTQSALQNYRLTEDPRVLAPYRAARTALPTSLDALDALAADDPELTALAVRQRAAATFWMEQYAAPTVRSNPLGTGFQTAGVAAYEDFRTANGAVGDRLRSDNAEVTRRITMLIWVFLGALGVVIVLGLAGTVGPTLQMVRRIGPPLEALQTAVGRLRNGELSVRSDPALGVVEIRAVATAVNELAAENERRHHEDAEEIRLGTVLRDLSVRIGSTLDLDEVLTLSVGGLSDYFGATTVWARVFDEHGPAAGKIFRHPDRRQPPPPSTLLDVGRRVAETTWRRQTYCLLYRDQPADPHLLSQTEQDAIFATPTQADSAHVLFVPIGVGPHCLGYVGMNRAAGQPVWSLSEITAMQGVGRDLGQAVVHARLFERESYLVDELREIDGRKNDFVSMVSHELRTPLASIIGHLEIVSSGDLGSFEAGLEPSLRAIDRNATRLTVLIEDLLLLSRIEQRTEPPTLTPVDLHQVALDVVDLLADTAARKQLQLRLDHDGSAVVVLGDHQELERVLSNLVANAIKYSARPGTVRIGLHTDGAEVLLQVADEGIGVSERDQAQLFERFFRSTDPRASAMPGTGLGLAITKLIVEKHGGRIELRSQLDVGSTFTVRLPPAREPSLSATRVPSVAGSGGAGAVAGRR